MIQQGSLLDTDQISHAQQWTNYWEVKLGVSTGFQHVEMVFSHFPSFRLSETSNRHNEYARPRSVK